MDGKVGRHLAETIRRRVSEDPTTPVEVVIKPRREDDTEAVLRELESVGGSTTEVATGAVYCQVPAGQIRRLASSELVEEIRAARVHRAHRRP